MEKATQQSNDNPVNQKPSVTPPVKSDHLPAEKKLTKEIILAKSKAGSLVEIKKIVIWGQKITDCSIVTEIPELEVASMTANLITSLEHFGQCPNLRELYLRSNRMRDLAEIYHLKELPNLQILWLADNPCTKHAQYRVSVIRNLEQLTTLDDREITQEEREKSEKQGILFNEPPSQEEVFFDVEKVEPLQDLPMEQNASKSDTETTEPLPQSPDSPHNMLQKEQQPDQLLPKHLPINQPQHKQEQLGQHQQPQDQQLQKPEQQEDKNKFVLTDNTAASSILSKPAETAQLSVPTQQVASIPRYAQTEIRTSVLRLIRLLDVESLQLVQLTIQSRLAAATTTPDSGVDSTIFDSNVDI